MILTVGGIKGGSGKSTLATHLAVTYAGHGRRVLLLDTDEQGTSSDFTQARIERLGDAGYTCTRQHGTQVRQSLQGFRSTFDIVIVDTGGRDSKAQRAALLESDIVAVPFVPRPFDSWTVDPLVSMLGDVRELNPHLVAVSYINRADVGGPQLRGAIELLEASEVLGLRYSYLHVRNRVAFGTAQAMGLSVNELRPFDDKAAAEMEALSSFMLALHGSIKNRELDNASNS